MAYALAILGAMAILFGIIYGSFVGVGAVTSDGPTQKARALAEGISVAMNCGALGFLLGVIAALGLLFCAWRWRRG
jgi:vacuolar-type H+-ATPase subunit I/STV1